LVALRCFVAVIFDLVTSKCGVSRNTPSGVVAKSKIMATAQRKPTTTAATAPVVAGFALA
jgi:hypothetical protein